MSRIAFLTPLPPQPTGIADYAARLLPALAGQVEVDVFCAHRRPRSIAGVRIRRPTRRGLGELGSYDAVVAQIGNSLAHEWIVDWVRRHPCTVVLHELVLHHLVGAITIGRGKADEYLELLHDEAGDAAVSAAIEALAGFQDPLWERAAERYPMTGVVARHASGIIVHSRYTADMLAAQGFAAPINVVPFPMVTAPRAAERNTDVDGRVTVGVFGFITSNKRLPVVLRALRLIAARVPGVRLLVVGETSSGLDVRQLAAQVGLDGDRVEVHGYSDERTYNALAARVDLGICLRHPTFGETSAAVLDFMARGVPVVVSTGGWYDELPDEAVARVAPDADEVLRLAATIEHLALDHRVRARMGEASFEFVRRDLAPERTADGYVRALLGQAGRPGLESDLERSLARAVACVTGVQGDDTARSAHDVGEAARQLGLLSGPS